MENYQFDIEGKIFECVECTKKIDVGKVTRSSRPVACEKCGVSYEVVVNDRGGISITVITSSEPEIIEMSESELEEEDPENRED